MKMNPLKGKTAMDVRANLNPRTQGQVMGMPKPKPMGAPAQGGSVRDALMQALQGGAVKPKPRGIDPRAMGAMVGNKLGGKIR